MVTEFEPPFKRLEIADWRQFDQVRLDFHPRLTVLTGANATGKSTLLGILARHFNWQKAYSASPRRHGRADNVWSNLGPRRLRRLLEATSSHASIGVLQYHRAGIESSIQVPLVEAATRQQYEIHLPNQQAVPGLFLDSHRVSSGDYVAVQTIPALFAGADQLFEYYVAEVRSRMKGYHTGRTPQLALKESLISAAAFGSPNNEHIELNREAADIWRGFQEVLRAVLPSSLGFQRLHIRLPDVIVESQTGDFVIDDASGGLSAIVEIAWQIYLRSRADASFAVLLDEPENHLHPSLQRDLLPGLLRAFPRAQFVVATHSPFVVTAAAESAVYALEYNSASRVEARELDYANRAASAEETLVRVLGLPSTAPIWAEGKFDEIISRHIRGSLTAEQVSAMRAELAASGLAAEFPDALVQLAEKSFESDTQ